MRIATYGEWNGDLNVEERKDDLLVEEFFRENPNNDHNYSYNTIKNPDEVVIELRLRPGKTNMIINITDQAESTMGLHLRELKILDVLRIGNIFNG